MGWLAMTQSGVVDRPLDNGPQAGTLGDADSASPQDTTPAPRRPGTERMPNQHLPHVSHPTGF